MKKKYFLFIIMVLTWLQVIPCNAGESHGSGRSFGVTGQLYYKTSDSARVSRVDYLLLDGLSIKYNSSQDLQMYDLKGRYSYILDGSNMLCGLNTNIVILKAKNGKTLNVWTRTEVVPGTFESTDRFNIRKKYNAVPDDLIVSSNLPESITLYGSSPKTQNVSANYSVGISATANGSGLEVNANATINTEKDALKIYNNSNSGARLFKILYDYDCPNKVGNKPIGRFLTSTTENLADFTIKPESLKTTFSIRYTLKLGYVKESLPLFSYWNNSEYGVTMIQQREVSTK